MPRAKPTKPKKRKSSARKAGAKKGAATKARKKQEAAVSVAKSRAKEKRAAWLSGHVRKNKVRTRVIAPRSYPVPNWADMQAAKGPFIAQGLTTMNVLLLAGAGVAGATAYGLFRKQEEKP